MKLHANYIKNSITPLDYYKHALPDVTLKRHDWNGGGLCPFHADKKTGSFYVNVETGAYKCFSCGAAGGDIIGFTMALYGLRFADATSQLANDWGLQ